MSTIEKQNCKYCGFTNPSRKIIMQHIRTVHMGQLGQGHRVVLSKGQLSEVFTIEKASLQVGDWLKQIQQNFDPSRTSTKIVCPICQLEMDLKTDNVISHLKLHFRTKIQKQIVNIIGSM